MFCNHCGKQLPDGARFCSGCGANLSVSPAEQAQNAPAGGNAPQNAGGMTGNVPQKPGNSGSMPYPYGNIPTEALQPTAKKSKAGLVVCIVIIIVLLAAVTAMASFILLGGSSGSTSSSGSSSGKANDEEEAKEYQKTGFSTYEELVDQTLKYMEDGDVDGLISITDDVTFAYFERFPKQYEDEDNYEEYKGLCEKYDSLEKLYEPILNQMKYCVNYKIEDSYGYYDEDWEDSEEYEKLIEQFSEEIPDYDCSRIEGCTGQNIEFTFEKDEKNKTVTFPILAVKEDGLWKFDGWLWWELTIEAEIYT